MAQIGDRVGPFELVERVGRGRRTSAFRAVRRDNTGRAPRDVSIQLAEGPPEEVDPALAEALRVRYETLKKVEDPRIPAAIARLSGHAAVAFQWVRAVPLTVALRLVRQGRIDLDVATSLDILVELAYALRNVHALVLPEGRIVHGAISADVVALGADGAVTLFGLGDPDPAHTWPLAPEQATGPADARTDQWQLGALGIELLRHAPEVVQETMGAPIEHVYSVLRARWPSAIRVLSRCLAEDPAHRYEVEERLVKDLLALARGLGGPSRRVEVGARALQLSSSLDAPEAPAARRVLEEARSRPRPLVPPTPLPEQGRLFPKDGDRFALGSPTPPPPKARVVAPDDKPPSTWPRHDARKGAAAATARPAAPEGPEPEPTLLERQHAYIPGAAAGAEAEAAVAGDPDWEETGEFSAPLAPPEPAAPPPARPRAAAPPEPARPRPAATLASPEPPVAAPDTPRPAATPARTVRLNGRAAEPPLPAPPMPAPTAPPRVEWADPVPVHPPLDPTDVEVRPPVLATPAIVVPPPGAAAIVVLGSASTHSDPADAPPERAIVEEEVTADRASGAAETTWVPDELTRGDPASVAFEEDSRDLPRLDTAEVVPLESDLAAFPTANASGEAARAEPAGAADAPSPADDAGDEVDVVLEDAPDAAPGASEEVAPAAEPAWKLKPDEAHTSAPAADPAADASTDPGVAYEPFVRPDPAPPQEDPLPDQVVVLAISVFLLVATGVLVWALVS